MNYPKLRVLNTQRQMVDTFKGYNHNLRIGEGEFYEMENMTSDYAPILAPRGKRGKYLSVPCRGIISKDALCFVYENTLEMHGSLGAFSLELPLTDSPKQLISMGAYIIILPDKLYVNTTDTEDWGYIEAKFSSSSTQDGHDVTFQLCDIIGDVYEDATVSATAPNEPADNALWIDTSSTPHALKKYTKTSEMWVAIPTTYIKISCPGINQGFEQYDGVTISGILDESLQSLNGSHAIQGIGEGYIVVTGILDEVTTQTAADGAVTVERKMPDMDFVIESENRLWGCKYNRDTVFGKKAINEIYASKLGDFKNWNCFMGLSTDSYVASCGSDGPFTGAITHMGHPLFFKEHCVHKVYGNYPANFQVQTTACRGVQEGCHKSLAIVNETLFYKSRGGVCAFDGSFPTEVSYALGNEQYSDAVAGGHKNKYYISMQEKDNFGAWHLFVYDVAKGMWHREDNFHADDFCSWRGEIYAIDHDTGHIITMLGSPGFWDWEKGEDQVKWMVQTGLIGTDMPDMKYISNLVVRLSPSKGAVVRFWVQYDSMGGWEHIHTVTCRSLRSLAIPLKPRRCDHLRLKIEGEGDVRIHSITKTIEQGSDVS